jgi:hypothetical protein
MFICRRCETRFGADATSAVLVCPRCHAKDAVFSPFTSWKFDLSEQTESEEDKPNTDTGAARDS